MMSDPEPETPPVDIVYTWVNGTDPKLLESIEFHVAKLEQANISVEFQVKISTFIKKSYCTEKKISFYLTLEHSKDPRLGHPPILSPVN